MKKIFTLFAILLVLVLPIVSCSSDDVSAKQAETDRGSLEIPNDEDTSNIQHNQLALYVSKASAQTGELVTFTTMLNGVNVTNQVSYFINNIEIGGYSIASNFPGTFQVQAKLEGYIDSPIVTVVYGGNVNPGPDPDPDPTGNFIFNGQGYTVTNNILVLNGASFVEGSTTVARSYWTSILVNNADIEQASLGAFIEFTTPFEITDPDTNNGNVILPSGNNEVYYGISQLLVEELYLENVEGSGQVSYPEGFSLTSTSNIFTSNIVFEDNSLQVNFNGAFVFEDNSQNERPTAVASQRLIKMKVDSNTKKSNGYKVLSAK